MTKKEFLDTLQRSLHFLSEKERKEILADYEEHFSNELASGKNEHQIATDLGNPYDISKQYQKQPEQEDGQFGSGNNQTQQINLNQNFQFNGFVPNEENSKASSRQYNTNNKYDSENLTEQPRTNANNNTKNNEEHFSQDNGGYSQKTNSNDFFDNNNCNGNRNTRHNNEECGRNTRGNSIVTGILLGIATTIISIFICTLTIAGFCVTVCIGVASITIAIAGFFMFANAGLVIGTLLICIGAGFICSFVFKALISVAKYVLKLVKDMFNSTKNVYNGGCY